MPVIQDAAGNYVPKDGADFQLHSWRTGKHTRGNYTGLGQLFLTENNLLVAVVATQPVAFKDRHDFPPLQRFTTERVADEVLQLAQTNYEINQSYQ